MVVVFLLFTVLVQAATAFIAQQTAEAAVAAAARHSALGSSDSAATSRLLEELAATVPGGRSIEAGVARDHRVARAWARFEFLPPGPSFRLLTFGVEAEVPIVTAP